MLNKDKLILVFYINIDGLSNSYGTEYMEQIKKYLENSLDESILYYFIPIKNHESKVECLNPIILDEEIWKLHRFGE